jgi:hypothetical protein
VNARSLADLAHSISGERHSELLARLADATDQLDEHAFAPGNEFAATLFEEAIEIIGSPRPSYLEAGYMLWMAASKDARFVAHWEVIDRFNATSHEIAMARIFVEHEADEPTEADEPKRVVN